MASYVFMRSDAPPTAWTLAKVISYGDGKRYRLANYRTTVGTAPVIEVWIIEAENEAAARCKLELGDHT